jgi:hypothetical protein
MRAPRSRPRRGYAMAMVVVFVTLFLTLWSLSFRQLSALLRLEAARTRHLQRDAGSLRAVARGLAALETGYPPAAVYVCSVSLDSGRYALTFRRTDPDVWTVDASASNDDLPPLDPGVFSSSPPE